MAPASSKCSARLSNSIWKRLGQGKIISKGKERAVFLLPPKQSDPLPSLSRTFLFPPNHMSAKGTARIQQLQWLQSFVTAQSGYLRSFHKGPGGGSTRWEDQATHYTPCTHYNCCTTAVTGLLGSPRSAPRANSWLISREHPSLGQVLKQNFAIA